MLMGDPRNRARMELAKQAEHAAKVAAKSETERFVTFALGSSRFALDSGRVKEVVMPDRVYWFPHTMPSLEGVLVRRGAAVPVCNVASAFGESEPCSRYVIAECSYRGALHSVAIPVSGDCELVQGQREDSDKTVPDVTVVTFVSGLLRTAQGTVPLLDMDEVVAHCMGNPSTPAVGVMGQMGNPSTPVVGAMGPLEAGIPGCNALDGREARQ
jgi:chemotaxis signal transduction protein